MPKPNIVLEESHGRPRTTLRGGTPALAPAPQSARGPDGRFSAGNQAAKRRALKNNHKGIATLNPAECPPWLAPHVEAAAKYGIDFAQRYDDDPVLRMMIGIAADHLAVAKGLLVLGMTDPKALAESRSWFKELRAYTREAIMLAGLSPQDEPADPFAAVYALAAEHQKTTSVDHNYPPDPNEEKNHEHAD